MRHQGIFLLLLLLAGCAGESGDPPMTEGPLELEAGQDVSPASELNVSRTTNTTRRLLGAAFGVQGDIETSLQRKKAPEVDVIYKTDDLPEPGWLVKGGMQSPPWEGAVYLAGSKDGLSFSTEKLFVDRAGVPHLLLTSEGTLVATFQYFSYEYEELFDVIAYTTSDDYGVTWSPVRKIEIEGEGFEDVGAGSPNPVDPTLVQLDDGSFRLYFTFHQRGEQYPGLFLAHAQGLEDAFQSEGPQLATGSMILDPAVVHFNGKWHHYTVRHGEKEGTRFVNVHSVSQSGNDFKLADDIPFDFQFLGQVIEDDGKLRFYGTGNGIETATSTDGYTWTKDSGTRAQGADPGIAKMPNGSYLLAYTRPK